MPPTAMPAIYAQADALLLTLIDDPLIAQPVPSKLQSYLAAGVPIVAAVNGEAGEIVRAAGPGIACPAHNAQALDDAIRALTAPPTAQPPAVGAAASRSYARTETRGVGETGGRKSEFRGTRR